MKSVLDDLGRRARELSEAIIRLIGVHAHIPSSEMIRASSELDINEIISRADVICNFSKNLSDEPLEKLLMVSTNRLASFRDLISNLTNIIVETANQIGNIEGWGGYDHIDTNGTVFTKSGNQFDLRTFLDRIVSLEDLAIDQYLPIASATKPRGIGTFLSAAKALSDSATRSENLILDLQNQIRSLATEIEAAKSGSSQVISSQEEAQRLLGEIEKLRRSAEEYQQKSAAAAAIIDETRAHASSVNAEVTEYEDSFKSFISMMEDRQKIINSTNKEVSDLTSMLNLEINRINSISDKANEMLGGATIAGLSSTYDLRVKSMDDELRYARNFYYGSIFLLLISVLISLNIIHYDPFIAGLPPLPKFDSTMSTGSFAIQVFASLGARLILILPTLLLVGFTAHRHSTLFRLREEYGHKYAISASVHGFEQQAPTYKEPIAASVFMELLQNPAKSMDKGGDESKQSNGILTRILEPAVRSVINKMTGLEASENTKS